MIFQETGPEPEDGNICSLGSALDVAQATVWGRQLESPCLGEALAEEGASGHCLGRQEPRPGREQGRAQGLDTGGFSIKCVLSFPPLLETGLMGASLSSSPSLSIKAAGIWRPFANHPSSDSLLHLVYFSNIKLIFKV